jgi:hypothetical protein
MSDVEEIRGKQLDKQERQVSLDGKFYLREKRINKIVINPHSTA